MLLLNFHIDSESVVTKKSTTYVNKCINCLSIITVNISSNKRNSRLVEVS